MKKITLYVILFAISGIANAQWQLSDSGIASGVTHCFIESSGILLAGVSWALSNTGIPSSSEIACLGKNSAGIFAGANGIYFSNDNGASWSTVYNSSDIVFAFAFLSDTIFAASMGGGVIMSANNGTSWTPTTTGITSNDIRAIVKKEHNLYAGTVGDGIFVSSNSGANWTLLPTSPLYIGSLETDGTNIYAGTFGSGIYKTSDNGASWTQITNGISATNYVFNITSIGNSLLAASGNAYRSIDHGASWTTFMNGIDTTCPYGVAGFYETSSYVFCGIEGGCDGSVFRINKNEVLSVDEISANKVSFSIYPNPFSNTTVLSTNKLFKNAVLTICNLYGQQIRQINNFSGQTFIFHRDNLPSGLYLIQVTQDNRTIITEKLVIIDN